MYEERDTIDLEAFDIYQAALELDEDARAEYIKNKTTDNNSLRVQVQGLLESSKQADEQGFLQTPAVNVNAINFDEASLSSFQTPSLHKQVPLPPPIGRYVPIKLIGEGGFGQVYLAEQSTPVSRQVALKLIKSELTDPRYIRRFDAERQMLALLNHPNIAQIFDAGTTESGALYFVMEYIEGASITDYCNQNKLNLEGRLDLFLQVCAAIQHAHHKGVIHRDIKPANVLVSTVNGKPVPKVIDFGIAKILDIERNTVTAATQLEFFGSPAYMSPEQIEQSELDVDTRSDVYGLGILLYELLVGSTPYADDISLITLMHEVVSEEALRPSEKVEAKSSARISDEGLGDKSKLIMSLQADLDWIILKALEKSRDSRYESCSAFAADINRYLTNQPVLARAPTIGYRARKFINRHTTGVISSLAILIIIIIGIVGTTSGYYNARKEAAKARVAEVDAQEQAKNAQQTVDLLLEFLSAVDPGARGRQLKVIDLLNAFKPRVYELNQYPVVQGSLMFTYAKTYFGLGLFDEANNFIDQAVQIRESTPGVPRSDYLSALTMKAHILRKLGDYKAAEDWGRKAMERSVLSFGKEHPLTLNAASVTADALKDLGKFTEAEALHRGTLALRRKVLGDQHLDTVFSMARLAVVLGYQNKLTEATQINRKVLELRTNLLGPDHPDTLNTMNNLAFAIGESGGFEEAEQLHRTTYNKRLTVLGIDHSDTHTSLANLAWTLSQLGRYEEAENLDREAMLMNVRVLGADHPETLVSMGNLANTLKRLDQLQPAEKLLRTVWQKRTEVLGPIHPATLAGLSDLTSVLIDMGDYQAAKFLLEKLINQQTEVFGEDHIGSQRSRRKLAQVIEGIEEIESVGRQ